MPVGHRKPGRFDEKVRKLVAKGEGMDEQRIAEAEARLAAFEDSAELPLSIEYGERNGRSHIHDAASKAYIDAGPRGGRR
jgi:hypothetical protein